MSLRYIKSLDGLRAIAILLVMAFHMGLMEFGWLGVQLFFVLSGYLITSILWKEKFSEKTLWSRMKTFWVRRSLRIFPVYYIYLGAIGLMYAVASFPSYFPKFAPYLFTYTFNFTRTVSEWQVMPFFTHLWSLCVEEQFYLFYPFLIFLLPKKGVKILLPLVVVLTPLTRYILGNYYLQEGMVSEAAADAVYWNTLSHLDAFFIGGLIPVFELQQKKINVKLLLLGSLVLVIVSGSLAYFNSMVKHHFLLDWGFSHGRMEVYEHVWQYTVLNIFFFSVILFISSFSQTADGNVSWGRKVLESKLLVKIGQVSYGMYLFHWAILFYGFEKLLGVESYGYKWLMFIPYVGVVYLVSKISFTYIEKPFILLKDKISRN